MRRRITLFSVALLALCTFSVQAEIYRWIDSDGQVNFTSQPPFDSDSEKITLPPPPPLPEPAPESSAEQAQPEADTEAAKREEAIRNNCKIARDNLEKLKSDSVVTVTGSDGKATTLDAAARKKLLADTQQEIDRYCSGS